LGPPTPAGGRVPERLFCTTSPENVHVKIKDLLEAKGNEVVTISPTAPLEDALRLLVEKNIGSLVVAEEKVVLGIMTERDVLRLVSKDRDRVGEMEVQELMTRNVIVGLPDDSLDYVMEIMTRNRIRHLPVVDTGWLHGIVSIGDVIRALRTKVEAENRYMRDYIQGKFF
jgi:CBS domain-containing protein